MAPVAWFCIPLSLIRSVLRTSNFCLLKLIKIVNLGVNYTIPFGFSLFLALLEHQFSTFNYFVWQIITDEYTLCQLR